MLSVPHLIVIFVVALVVFGPEKLPELARTVGKVMAEFRRATGDLKSTFEDHLREIERETSQMRIDGPKSATPAAPQYAPVEQEDLTVPTTPPHLTGGTEPSSAPWEHAADTAADAMNISPDAPEPSAHAAVPENPQSSDNLQSPENFQTADKPHQEIEENTETPIHDLPA
jgi:TatA/E family protein of Tat protein translocase